MAGVEDIKAYIMAILGVALAVSALLQVILPMINVSGAPTVLATLGPLVVAFAAILAILKLV